MKTKKSLEEQFGKHPFFKISHTPTPWKLQTGEYDQIHLLGAGGADITSFGNFEDERANAAYIVRAVNSHEELLGTVKVFKNYLGDKIAQGVKQPEIAMYEQLEAIIAKAEGAI